MNSNKSFFCSKFYLLPAGSIHIAQAALVYLGKQYYSEAGRDIVYLGFPKMRIVDMCMAGIFCLAALLQICGAFGKNPKKKALVLRFAYFVLMISQIGYAAARYKITVLTPFSYSQILQASAYLLILIIHFFDIGRKDPGSEDEQRNIVCSDSVLQGAGSSSGDSESSEDKDDGTDQSGEDC